MSEHKASDGALDNGTDGIDMRTLLAVLTKMLGAEITGASFQAKRLHGGTVGSVRLVAGTAHASDGRKLSYNVVLKIQKKWERPGDPDSWRREYDLYSSCLADFFSDSLRWPECYHAEMAGDETRLWLEYADGVSGLNLTGEMYERAARELGRFQGRLYAERPPALQSIANLGNVGYMKNFYLHYRSWKVVYDYVRSDSSEMPAHLRKMLVDVDENADEIFARIEKLPIVLCHRDFWVANIIHRDGKTALIDWDTAGWGYMGEDIASLIADEADVARMAEHYHRCVRAYYDGFCEHARASRADHCVREMILVMFGYRLVEWYLRADSPEDKALHLDTLQKIYELEGSAQ